jgi:hypothetical protein
MSDGVSRNPIKISAGGLSAALLLLMCFAGTCRADIVDFNFTGNNGTADPVSATFVATNLVTPVKITRVGPDMIAQSHANSFLGNNWPTSSTVVPSKDYFSFTIAATSGHAIDLSAGGMSLNLSTQANGPTKFVVRSSLDNFGSDIALPFTPSINQTSQDIFLFAPYLTAINQLSPVSGPIEFRLYGYFASQANKQLWLESSGIVTNAIQVTGSIVPVPEPTCIFSVVTVGAGIGCLVRYARLRRRS